MSATQKRRAQRSARWLRAEDALRAIQRTIESVPDDAWEEGERVGDYLWQALDAIDEIAIRALGDDPSVIDGQEAPDA